MEICLRYLFKKNAKVFVPDDDILFREEKWKEAMIIGDFQVQHVLRSYSRQLADGSRASKGKVDKRTAQKDEVTISVESKKRLLADKITAEIMTQFSKGSELTQTGRRHLDRLSREYGQPLELSYIEEQGMVFVVPDQTGAGDQESFPDPRMKS